MRCTEEDLFVAGLGCACLSRIILNKDNSQDNLDGKKR